MRHRPIGIGVQGLADCFILMRMPFDGEDAKKLNIQIFETIHHSALKTSCELAKEKGKYSSYEGSPVSKGVSFFIFFNLWLLIVFCFPFKSFLKKNIFTMSFLKIKFFFGILFSLNYSPYVSFNNKPWLNIQFKSLKYITAQRTVQNYILVL